MQIKYAQAFLDYPVATLKLARSLKIGDVLECMYADGSTRLEMVVQGTPNSKEGTQWDIKTIPLECFGKRFDALSKPSINTDRYRKVGAVSF